MRRILASAVLLVVWASTAFACGDKFLVVGRTARPDQVSPAISARILIFERSATTSSANLQGTLVAFGHEVDIADSPEQLSEALGRKPYDIVVTDFSDADGVVEKLRSASSDAMLLPVVEEAAKDEAEAAEKEYHVVLKVPSKPKKILSTIEETLEKKNSLAMK